MTIAPERPVDTTLVPDHVRARLAHYITREHPEFTVEFAERLVVAAAQFQAASAAHPHVRMAPSKLVDHGWHAWLMHTHERDALQARIGGVVHHVPDEDGDPDPAAADEIRHQTLQALRAAGFTADEELWGAAADCSQCHAGCTDSPNSGGKK